MSPSTEICKKVHPSPFFRFLVRQIMGMSIFIILYFPPKLFCHLWPIVQKTLTNQVQLALKVIKQIQNALVVIFVQMCNNHATNMLNSALFQITQDSIGINAVYDNRFLRFGKRNNNRIALTNIKKSNSNNGFMSHKALLVLTIYQSGHQTTLLRSNKCNLEDRISPMTHWRGGVGVHTDAEYLCEKQLQGAITNRA